MGPRQAQSMGFIDEWGHALGGPGPSLTHLTPQHIGSLL